MTALVLVLMALGIRQYTLMVIPGDPKKSDRIGRNGLADFQDVIYYPLQAVRDGVNPYDCGTDPLPDGSPRYRQRYPVLNLFPLYSPLLFALYYPFSFGDFVFSGVVYMAFNVGLLLWLAYVCWRIAGRRPNLGQTTLLTSVMLATLAGRANFLGGETAIPLALASLGALRLSPGQPWLAGLALAVTSFKPTFGLPLGILLLACGHYRTVAIGWSIGLVVGIVGLLLIFSRSGDLARMPEILLRNQQVLESDPDVDAQLSATRVDTAGAIECWSPLKGRGIQLAASLLVLCVAAGALFQLRTVHAHPEVEALTTAIVALSTISSIYHLKYDAVLLWAAIAGVALAPQAYWPHASRRWRWVVASLLFTPMINVLGTHAVSQQLPYWFPGLTELPVAWRNFFWTVVCTLNGLALLAALGLMAQHARRLVLTLMSR